MKALHTGPVNDYVGPDETRKVEKHLGNIVHVKFLDRAQSIVESRKCTHKMSVVDAVSGAVEAVMLKMIHELSRNREARTFCIDQKTNNYVHTTAGLSQLVDHPPADRTGIFVEHHGYPKAGRSLWCSLASISQIVHWLSSGKTLGSNPGLATAAPISRGSGRQHDHVHLRSRNV